MRTGEIRDHLRESRLFGARLTIVASLVVALTAVLFLRLAYIQIVNYRHFATLSQENRIKPVPIPPVRGTGTTCKERSFGLSSGRLRLRNNTTIVTVETIPASSGASVDAKTPVSIAAII